MRRYVIVLGLVVQHVAAAMGLSADVTADRAGIEFFETRVRPVLVAHCYKCHSAGARRLKADLRLDSRSALLQGGIRGPAIVPGQPEESLLIQAINHDPACELEMPPESKLPAAAIADLTAWVRSGAPWPEEQEKKVALRVGRSADSDAIRATHWAFQPLSRPAIPAVRNGGSWVKTPIDAFILSKLEAAGIQPCLPADPRTLLRRIYLDLIGLPPTPQEQQTFVNDSSPDALARVVDDLLGRPQYGERWGRHWLDVARFAESQGYERDEPKPHAWRYRDYVIDAFNRDKPYDRFVLEQLAGDELDDADAETMTAVSFLRLGAFDTIAADAKLARYDQMDDVVGTVTAAFLGQTLRCARCHDHKFEPYSQEDYYRILAVFDPLSGKNTDATHAGSAEQLAAYQAAQAAVDGRISPLEESRDAVVLAILDQAATKTSADAPANKETTQRRPLSENVLSALRKPASQRTKSDRDSLKRSRQRIDDYVRPLATPDQLSQLDQVEDQIRRLDTQRPRGQFAYIFSEESSTPPSTNVFLRGDVHQPGPEVVPAMPRLLTDTDLPPPVPTTRTSGRRIWLANFITGDGQALAARVMANRIWQYHFGLGIVPTSNDFGVHGEPPTHPELLEWLASEFVAGNWTVKRLHRMILLSSVYQSTADHRRNSADPDSRLLWHWRARRLESEAIRDSILAVSGRINLESSGPSVFPQLAQKLVGASAGLEWKTSDAAQSSRRSVYVYVKRNIAVPELDVMGTADASASMERRPAASTALQSLMLLNSRFTNEHAAAFADRVRAAAGDDPRQQVQLAYEWSLCRLPSDGEVNAVLRFLNDQAQLPPSGGEVPLSPLASFCLVLFNTNEFIYMN